MTIVSLQKACDWLGHTGKGRERRLRERLQRLEATTPRSFLVPSDVRRGPGVRYRVDLDMVRRHAPHLIATGKRDFSSELAICFKKIDEQLKEMRNQQRQEVGEIREDIGEIRDKQQEQDAALIGIAKRVGELSLCISRPPKAT